MQLLLQVDYISSVLLLYIPLFSPRHTLKTLKCTFSTAATTFRHFRFVRLRRCRCLLLSFLTKYRECYTKQAFLIIFIKVFETLLYIFYLKFDAECLAVWVVHRLLTFFSQLQSVLLENWRKNKRKRKRTKSIESVQMFNHCLICFLQCFDPVFLQKYMCNRIDV